MERRRGQAGHSELRSRHDEFFERAFRPRSGEVACFDQDGTTWVEQPIYTQVVYCLNGVPDLVKAKPELANEEPFKTVMSGDRAAMAKLPTADLYKILEATLTGMTVDTFRDLVQQWITTARDPRWIRTTASSARAPRCRLVIRVASSSLS